MEVAKIVGVGLIALVIVIILRQNKPEFVIYAELMAGIIILTMSFDKIAIIIDLIQSFSSKLAISNRFVMILLKITGIAILTEFAVSICKDAGESSIASKIEIGSKVMIVTTSIPIVSSLLEVVLKVLP
ncbi:MAG: stage III sporulation AC/AD family protein [Clostridia bacterium]|nr:stage III sporulation AC/AD family protein [Clostridia bacterium]